MMNMELYKKVQVVLHDFEPVIGVGRSPNIILGYQENSVDPGLYGATIGGGESKEQCQQCNGKAWYGKWWQIEYC